MISSGSFPQGVRVNKDQGREGGGMNRVFISLRPLVPKKVGKVTVAQQNETIPVMVLQPHILVLQPHICR